MTREQFQRFWPEIEAFKNGADIQVQDGGLEEWNDTSEPDWIITRRYRVKPRRFELYVNVYPNGAWAGFSNVTDAQFARRANDQVRTVYLVELKEIK